MQTMNKKVIYLDDAIKKVIEVSTWFEPEDEQANRACKAIRGYIEQLPSAQPEIAENLYMYKCYITDKDGLQHDVIHTDDIRRVTGWVI